MEISFENSGGALCIRLKGDIDDAGIQKARSRIDSILDKERFYEVVFDFSGVPFMDSTGIGVLIGRYKYLKNKNKNIYISNPSNTVDKIFRMSGIFEIMPKIS